jgi:L-arabinokinase
VSLPADTQRFVELLYHSRQHPSAAVRSALRPGDAIVARAPGRLDVMGGIADYSGSLVLQWPIAEATHAALQRDPASDHLHIVSMLGSGDVRVADVPCSVLADAARAVDYDAIRSWFAADPAMHWAGYVAGAWAVLARERDVTVTGGRVLVHSLVPEGKGVSSSAALEAAVMEALTAADGVSIPPRDRSLLCQRVENLIVGAPCGIMDQMATVFGEAGQLMALLCQPAEFKGSIPLPPQLAVWGIDSGIRHAVTGADYGSVRVGAFMGYRVLADLAGFTVTPGERVGHVRVNDTKWNGYLANVGPSTFATYEDAVPERISGAAFLDRYSGTTDLVTTVDPARTYAVRVPTRHPIDEHARVTTWYGELQRAANAPPSDIGDLAQRLGTLMYESHASYSACGLGSDGTDRLVGLAREAGPARGVFGAKITGGGSGGTVALLTTAAAGEVVQSIAAAYARESGRAAHVFSGSSQGAARFGTIRVTVL